MRGESLAKEAEKYPLGLSRCTNCSFLQLTSEPISTQIYQNYLYESKVTKGLSTSYAELARGIKKQFRNNEVNSVLDIGCNDGSFLQNFQDSKIIVGIDPSIKLSEENNKKFTFINDFFNAEQAKSLKDLGPFSLIAINYTLANIDNPIEILNLIGSLMNRESLLSIVTGYHPDQFQFNMFEYINHDHISYFRLTDINNLCNLTGLKIVDAKRISAKGGSIHIMISRKESKYVSTQEVLDLLQRESMLEGLEKLSISNLKIRLQDEKEKLLSALPGNMSFIGLGASISTTSLMREFQLEERISHLVDDNVTKVGLYSPGAAKLVESLEELGERRSQHLIMLAWHHKRSFINRLNDVNFKGRVLVPLPTFRVVDFS